jgi:DNA helicase HerA-like ATPase
MNMTSNSGMNLAAKEDTTQQMGRIVSVTGSQAIVLLDPHNATQHAQKNVSPELGTLLAIRSNRSTVFGMISALSVPIPSHEGGASEMRIVELELLGELPRDENGNALEFRRGVSFYPCLGDRARLATRAELKDIYSIQKKNTAVRIGSLRQDQAIPAMVTVDELLGKHFAILGTTGTGKSCVVALILRAILKENPQAHMVLLDPHNEYSSCFGNSAEVITPQNLNLPFWLMTFEETVEVLIGSQSDGDHDADVLAELIPLAKAYYASKNTPSTSGRSRLQRRSTDTGIFTVDTPVPYRISDLMILLQEKIGRLDQRGALAPYKRLKMRLEAITQDPRYSFMFGNLTVQDDMATLLGRLFRIPVNGKPITIFELTGFPSEVTNVVVSVLCRMTFDFGLWSEGHVPITLICEEAHRYVPEDTQLGFEPTKRAIARIAKEGRKYGVSLGIITQRPAELDATILSQCNTVFAMRMTNEKDQEIVKAAISDAAASMLEFIPSMRDREAVAFGEGLALPGRIHFDSLPEHALPRRGTASFSDQWTKEITNTDFIDSVVARWRASSAPESIAELTTPEKPGDEVDVDKDHLQQNSEMTESEKIAQAIGNFDRRNRSEAEEPNHALPERQPDDSMISPRPPQSIRLKSPA